MARAFLGHIFISDYDIALVHADSVSSCYSYGAVLGTPLGEMRGSYQMNADDGVELDAEIQTFVLTTPRTLH